MRPENLKTRIFLDGGDPKETQDIIGLTGFLDGQTTNPTLIAKIPYRNIDLSGQWSDYDLSHELTDKGMEKFSADWNSLIA
jgi:transaldolase